MIDNDIRGSKIHLYWSGSQWVLHYDLDPSKNFDNLLAYAKVKELDPCKTASMWFVKYGKTFEPTPSIDIGKPGLKTIVTNIDSNNLLTSDEYFGVPRNLIPYYMAFMFDAIATGLAMPLLPFYVMELGASALQLSLVISSNYIAQMIGCIVMGKVSDLYGRRVVLGLCLLASSTSYFFVSRAKTLTAVALSRIICGAFGGLIPIMQSSVADSSSLADRPKYIGRIMATFGIGFVLGPALSAITPNLSTREKIRLASLLPLTGFAICFFFAKETKIDVRGLFSTRKELEENKSKKKIAISDKEAKPVSMEVLMLVLNGFLLMYAFSTETIYAMFIKDSFGYGERALSALFACNGLFIGLFQVLFIKPLIGLIGKHGTLIIGNSFLALGMVGIALIRKETLHFVLFTVHIVGYSIADTTLASLISRYSSPKSQGRDLALNQAAQACARVLSPLVAGFLYEKSKQSGLLPIGALPFLVGAMFPAIGIAVPCYLYIRSVSKKKKINKLD